MKNILKLSLLISVFSFFMFGIFAFSNMEVGAEMLAFVATDIDTPSTELIIQEVIIGIFCFSPWIALIIYLIVKKYQIRYYLFKDTIFCTQRMGKNKPIVLPDQPVKVDSQFLGWFYYDYPDKPFVEETMPAKNLKLIAKFNDQVE